jgi:asparagine synthase (glutamine-hydrolysing)
MCGIAGIGFSSRADLESLARNMVQAIAHRGPDGKGVWCDEAATIALAHRRLSVMDLTAAGHQPMHSASGRYILTYNGEIYNFRELREELAGPWHGHSDTELLLAAVEQWGIEPTLKRCNGMFAFALWDKQERALTLARDPMGEKPLYYGWHQGDFLFASELAAMHRLDHFSPTINRHALNHYMRMGYVAAPDSIYEGIHQLSSGHWLTLREKAEIVKPVAYWSLEETVLHAKGNPLRSTEGELIDQCDHILSSAVKNRMIADVPLGAFLSGGTDSTAITLMMQRHSAQPIKTFTIGFQEKGFDEAVYAKKIARHLQTDHTELYVSAKDALEVIPKLPQLYSEPFSDSSQIPTYLVATLAKQKVTVALSGDGGDELFGGYNRHIHAPALWKKISLLPIALRKLLACLLQRLPNASRHRHKLIEALVAANSSEFYHLLRSFWPLDSSIVAGVKSRPSLSPVTGNFSEWMMQQDRLDYLPGDILTKVDRAAMAVGLETRIPFLDPELIHFSAQLPLEMKIRNGQGKWILRQLLYRHIPEEMIDRPKSGFALPLAEWLREPLRDWAESLLDESIMHQQGYLHTKPIMAAWQQLLKGNDAMESRIWTALMFQSWLAQHHSII